ncbi:MAG: HDOD domain-containing protein [Planctomycetes bacterium]|nr:HDOD domain-containing protein [Planctomycetota bacterium]
MSHSALSQLALQEKTRREILHKSDLIPPLPDLVTRLLALLYKQDTEPRDLEQLLQNDQVLVAKMLAMVNSPFYGLNRSIGTVKDAVMVLGFRGLRSLVLATSTAKFMQRDFSCYGHDAKGLWLHAVCVAGAARALARKCGLGAELAEQLFVGGLLHDIGKMLLVTYLGEAGHSVKQGDGVCEFERQLLGLDHTEAGALVTAKWNLSREIQDVVGSHHRCGDRSTGVAIVRIADGIAHELGTGYLPGRAPSHEVAAEDLATLGFDEAAWPALRDELAAVMEEAVLALGNISG